jgi:hypothetical protein
MTTHQHETRPTTPAREIGPGRFQRPDGPSARPAVWRSIGSIVLLLAIVVGVPLALLWLDGVPQVPTSLPTRDQLTATIGPEQVLAVLVWVAWLAWFQFTVCVLVELRSALAGIGLPARVPLSGPSQRFARTLIASVLLLLTTVGPASAIAHAPTFDEGGSAVAVVMTVEDVEAAPQPAAEDVAPATVTYQLGGLQLSAEEGAALVGRKVYVVQPPEGRYHDNLWDIAERSLGDGRRYQEIYDLNTGRAQADGNELSLARLIYPNWLLVMPEDAVGVDRVVAVETPAPEAPVSQATPTETAGSLTAGSLTAASATENFSAVDHDVAGDLEAPGTSSTQQLLGAGLLAAGVIAALEHLRRRRRTAEPSDAAVELEVALRVGADPDRAAALDRSLRHLVAVLRESGRDLPGVYAATVDNAVTLHLAPADAAAPTPWVAEDDGRRWVLDTSLSLPVSRRLATAPFPGLVSLGRDDSGADVLVDLEAAQGPVAVVGDPTAALEVATAIAVELATNRWSDQLRVTGVWLPTELAALDPVRYRQVEDVAEVLPALRSRRADALGAGVLAGRMRGSGASAWMPEYLVLGSVPQGPVVDEILDLAATDARSPLGVVCVGELPGARWRFEVDSAGTLAIGLLGVRVRSNRLSRSQAAGLAELLTPSEPEVDDRRAAQEYEGSVERPDVSPPERRLDLGVLATAAVRVHVLGEPRVDAAGPIDPARVALATELVVHLALHPEGVHPTVLAASLWPRGVTPEVRAVTIARAREWLGSDTSGAPHLRETGDGRLRLGPGVVLDWDVVRSLLGAARVASSVAEERRLLADALRLAGGPLLAGRTPGRYSWLARVRLERAAHDLLVDAAHRLVVLSRHDDDPGAAQDAARSGLRVAPTDELLWRDLLRASVAIGGTDAAQQIAAELETRLHEAGLPVSSLTTALLDELLPGEVASDLLGRL